MAVGCWRRQRQPLAGCLCTLATSMYRVADGSGLILQQDAPWPNTICDAATGTKCYKGERRSMS
jgi:hypothetical protein